MVSHYKMDHLKYLSLLPSMYFVDLSFLIIQPESKTPFFRVATSRLHMPKGPKVSQFVLILFHPLSMLVLSFCTNFSLLVFHIDFTNFALFVFYVYSHLKCIEIFPPISLMFKDLERPCRSVSASPVVLWTVSDIPMCLSGWGKSSVRETPGLPVKLYPCSGHNDNLFPVLFFGPGYPEPVLLYTSILLMQLSSP